jgi:hypothetical protein
MKREMLKRLGFGVIALSAAVALVSHAAQPGAAGDKGVAVPESQQMSAIVHDMSVEMREMADQLSKGNLSAQRQKLAAKHLREMADMTNELSGMIGHDVMAGGEMPKQTAQMRKRMDAIRHDMRVAPSTH